MRYIYDIMIYDIMIHKERVPGKVEYTEFIAAAMDHRVQRNESICWRAFKAFDKDGQRGRQQRSCLYVHIDSTM